MKEGTCQRGAALRDTVIQCTSSSVTCRIQASPHNRAESVRQGPRRVREQRVLRRSGTRGQPRLLHFSGY